jgi:hypothetical protein
VRSVQRCHPPEKNPPFNFSPFLSRTKTLRQEETGLATKLHPRTGRIRHFWTLQKIYTLFGRKLFKGEYEII